MDERDDAALEVRPCVHVLCALCHGASLARIPLGQKCAVLISGVDALISGFDVPISVVDVPISGVVMLYTDRVIWDWEVCPVYRGTCTFISGPVPIRGVQLYMYNVYPTFTDTLDKDIESRFVRCLSS